MFWVYVLKSEKYNKFYTGQTDNLDRRLQEHNEGKSIYSRRYRPWIVVYTETYSTVAEAISREQYLKSAAGRRWLKKLAK
jgi:putative endonuclease